MFQMLAYGGTQCEVLFVRVRVPECCCQLWKTIKQRRERLLDNSDNVFAGTFTGVEQMDECGVSVPGENTAQQKLWQTAKLSIFKGGVGRCRQLDRVARNGTHERVVHEKKRTKEQKEIQLCNDRVVGKFVPRDRQGRMSVLKLLVRCSGFVGVDFVSPRIEGLEKSMLGQPLMHLVHLVKECVRIRLKDLI